MPVGAAARERLAFSERLREVLRDADYAHDSPSQLAREFNLHYDGAPVTPHAARKWLAGEAIPTQEKLRALAQWLGVSARWLRFGGRETTSHDDSGGICLGQFDRKDLSIIESLRHLNEKHCEIVVMLIHKLGKTQAG